MDITHASSLLLRALQRAIQGNKGVQTDPDERILDAEGLAIKCLFHASSCLQLYGGTTLQPGAKVLDAASHGVLARATIESLLTFRYVFVDPEGDPAKELRHLSWVLADLQDRQEFEVTEPAHHEQLARERSHIENLQTRIRANVAFQKLGLKQQRAVLERGQWRDESWTDIGLTAGLSRRHAEQAYRYLCSFAHSGSLSVLQVRQAKSPSDQALLAEGALRLVNVAVAYMVTAYCAFFPRAAQALATESVLSAEVDRWIKLGQV
jgi:hypothetical protein